jgi:hypothetical protein
MTDVPMTTRQMAAVLLRVPASGDATLDAMIRESERRAHEGIAMAALMLHHSLVETANMVRGENTCGPWTEGDVADFASMQAEAMAAQSAQRVLDF